ncbi:MAG: winged helix-turn-helix domain-containing protein, partial [Desulfuromonadaceae bacterium]
ALRRSLKHADEPVFKNDELVVDLTLRHVFADGVEMQLTPTEYDLLRLFITHAGKVLTHSQILKQIWGTAYQEQSQVLRVTISNLRKKIERDPSRPKHITTEPGVGYRLRIQG